MQQLYKYNGTGNSGVFAWLMQRVSGLVLAICGTVIFCQIIFSEQHGFSAWLLAPVLGFGLWHTFSGFKMITDDYVSNEKLRFFLFFLYWAKGVALFALGFLNIP
ncbi:MAG: succinate dehydrogenase [Deferribacteraceae bacterium]|jgi:succinate dehydrogenase / fumarate reductase membrane anchor subunit|nr:succinate dehydrogenase [Deferribacteraceae bacterium]